MVQQQLLHFIDIPVADVAERNILPNWNWNRSDQRNWIATGIKNTKNKTNRDLDWIYIETEIMKSKRMKTANIMQTSVIFYN